jgi:hypothetical protein
VFELIACLLLVYVVACCVLLVVGVDVVAVCVY